ncbi:MAG TPA: immunity 22 family protein, partial [Gemmataceae bacterium]|nr:immunity 22 family protein [Gemmataceae bacterium]
DAYFTEEYDTLDVLEGPVHWVPSRFQTELGLRYYPPWHFEMVFPDPPRRSVAELLADVTFSESFGPLVIAEAQRKGITTPSGMVFIFHFDYLQKPGAAETVGPVRFLGSFPFVFRQPADAKRYRAVADRTGLSLGALETVAALLADCTRARPEDSRQFNAGEFCRYVLGRGEGVRPLLLAHGLTTSERLGRVVMTLVDAGLARKSETDSEADFAGLFDLNR